MEMAIWWEVVRRQCDGGGDVDVDGEARQAGCRWCAGLVSEANACTILTVWMMDGQRE